ncbi:MAG: hypothetical protein ACRDT4_25890, partial [Micromonosporaceae bacterium]
MAQSSQRKANRKPSQQPARKAAPERSAAPPAADRPLLPGATLVWVLLAGATLWFAGQMWALRGTLSAVVENVELGPDAITALVTFGLPTVISSAVVLGAATGLGVAVLLSGRFEDTRVVRLATAAGAGLLAAGVAGSALYASGYGTAAPIGVGVAALLG